LEKLKSELAEEKKNSQVVTKALESAQSVIKTYEEQKSVANGEAVKQNELLQEISKWVIKLKADGLKALLAM
jgi:hypothetical protein